MNILADIEILIETLQAIVTLIETLDTNAAQNPVLIKLQNAINTAKSLNL